MKRFVKVLSRVRSLLFPRKCTGCSTLLDWYDSDRPILCDACLERWEREMKLPCDLCAGPISKCTCMTEPMKKAGCASFRKLTYYRHGKRDEVQSRMIYRIKNTRDRETTAFLADRLLRVCEQELAALSSNGAVRVTYVPRSTAARLESGTDQARELAKTFSHLSGLPVERLIERSTRRHTAQKKLSARDRQRNAEQAFRLSKRADVKGKTVILIDDIVTTGATAAACVKLLRKGGASQVLCLAVASNELERR